MDCPTYGNIDQLRSRSGRVEVTTHVKFVWEMGWRSEERAMYEIDILGFLMSNIEIIGPALSCASLDCEFMVWTFVP